MRKEIKRKNIIFYSTFLAITLIMLYIFLSPESYVKFNGIQNLIRKISSIQNIAPQRLFINAWRTTKNSYVDETLNNQDWLKWRMRYFKHIKTIEDADVAINSMLASLNDPYTKFLKSDLFSKQKIILDAKVTGVGILFNKSDDNIVITHVIDNSPAQAAKIMAGDIIVGINGSDTKNMEVNSAIELIENSKNVELVLKRNSSIITLNLKKKDIPLKTMGYEITKDNIGIITLANIMGESSVNEFKNILEATNKTKGIIIDLRNNYGGILANAVQMANFMLDVKKIISIESRVNKKYQIYSDNEEIFTPKPVVILINNKTASAAEILAGTLRDNIGAVLVGERSFGKNSIQQVILMQNSTGLLLTTDKYILPNGEDIYHKGLTPDIVIKQKNIISRKNDIQLQKAIEIINEKSN
jgi:carboxyl-terminal processing protease